MSTFNDISWRSQDNKIECESNAQLFSLFARRFGAGYWSLLGPGSEKKWSSNSEDSPQGEWDKLAEKMMVTLAKSGHPVFRVSSPLSRGQLKSKGGGKLSIHYCVDQDTITTVFRTISSVNQFSLYGAVAEMCEEYESVHDRTTKPYQARPRQTCFWIVMIILTKNLQRYGECKEYISSYRKSLQIWLRKTIWRQEPHHDQCGQQWHHLHQQAQEHKVQRARHVWVSTSAHRLVFVLFVDHVSHHIGSSRLSLSSHVIRMSHMCCCLWFSSTLILLPLALLRPFHFLLLHVPWHADWPLRPELRAKWPAPLRQGEPRHLWRHARPHRERIEKLSQQDRLSKFCRIPECCWNLTVFHDERYCRILTNHKCSGLSWVHFAKRWRNIRTKRLDSGEHSNWTRIRSNNLLPTR